MIKDTDHIEALRNRLVRKRQEKEAEITQINEMIRVLGDAPRVLLGRPVAGAQQSDLGVSRPKNKAGAPINTGLAKHVDEYLETMPVDTAISLKDMIAALRADYGVTGKDTSLYAYIHSLLKKKATQPNSTLRHEKGVGFFKSANGHGGKRKERDAKLVATIGPEGTTTEAETRA